MLEVRALELDGVLEIRPRRFGDDRGFFSEVWREDRLAEVGVSARFVQDNHSRSQKGVLRDLHYQLKNPQGKLVRVTVGEVLDVQAVPGELSRCEFLRREARLFDLLVQVVRIA